MKKVLCVVVTYNRLECLKECISGLKSQTCQDFDTLVVNNGSTDGTGEFLNHLANVIVITQENLGSSGGQYAGMKYGFEKGYEWVWMMDDDGYPESHQLEELLRYGEKRYFFLNALVINKDNHNQLSFMLGDMSLEEIKKHKLIEYQIAPFNGTFVHRDAIEKSGFVKRDMFIWGDEQEYRLRLIKNGFIPHTVVNAIHYHPAEKGRFFSAFPPFIKATVLEKPEKMSKYYYRNCGYIDATYFKGETVYSIKRVLYHCLFFLRTGRLKEISKFIKYYFRGRKDNYND